MLLNGWVYLTSQFKYGTLSVKIVSRSQYHSTVKMSPTQMLYGKISHSNLSSDDTTQLSGDLSSILVVGPESSILHISTNLFQFSYKKC